MSVISKLQIILEANTAAFDNGLKKATAGLQGFAKKTDEIHSKMDKFARKNKDALEGLQSAGRVAAVGLGVMALGIKGAVTAAVDFEKSMAGVKKVVEFETPAQFQQMQQDIIALSQRLPMVATDIAAIMEAAGQSGIARDELARFAESAAKMGVAFDITAEQAGKAMAQMRASFGMSQTEVETLADQINYLGNNSTNSAAEIMEVVQRIGSLAEVANISSSTLAALTASVVGVAPEVAATSLKNFALQLTKGESLSKSAKAAFAQMGLDYNQVAKDMQTDSEATIQKVLKAAQSVPEHMRAAVLNDAFGSESIAVISQLVTNYEAVDKNLQAMGDSATYAGSMLKEFEGMAGTSAAQMQLFDNNITAMKIAFGTAFLPMLNQAMEAITPVIKSITDWTEKNPELVRTITVITAGVLGAVAVLGGLALAFTAVTSGIGAVIGIGSMIGGFFSAISTGVGIVKMFAAALAALGFPVTAVVAGIAAVIAIGVLLYNNWDMVKAKAIEVWNAIPQYASQAWQWVQGIWSGVGAWFGGIWDSVVSSVSNAWAIIQQAFANWLAGMPAPVQEMVANIGSIFSGITAIASAAWAGITAVAKTVFGAVVAIWQGLASAVSSAWQEIVSVATSVCNAVKSAVSSAINAIKPIISSVAGFFSTAWNSLISIAASVWNGIKAAASVGISGIKAVLTAGMSIFASVFNAGFNLIKNAFTTAFNVIKSLVRGDMQGVAKAIGTGLANAAEIVRRMVAEIVGAFKNLGSRLLQAGRDAIQGFINGVRQKMNEAISIARDMAGSVVSSVKSALNIRSPSRVMRQLGAWAGEGFVLGVGDKIGDAKKAAENLANALTSTIADLHRQNFMLINQANPLADLEYKLQFGELADLTDKQKDRLRELAKVNLDIQKANEKTAESLRQQETHAQNILNANERSKSNYDSLQKQLALFGNTSKLAEFDYDWKNGAFAGADNMLILRERNAIAELERLQTQNKTKADFEQIKGDMASKNPLAELKKQLDDRLTAIKEFENAHTGVVLEAQEVRQQAEQAYFTAKNNLLLDNYANMFGGISSMTKSFFGEQSGIYRAMFAMEKGFAIAKAILALKANIAEASKIGFPQNIPMIASAVSQGVAIVNDIRSVAMPIGQAHDGIMSVPKSGTWNLEKGERVLPKHTAKNLDKTLATIQGGGSTVNVSVTVNSSGGDVQADSQMGKRFGEAIKLAVQAELQKERRQGGLLYGR